MRLLMIQNAVYLPAYGGANKATRAVVEGLAERGHVCRAVVRAHSVQGPASTSALLAALDARGITPRSVDAAAVVFDHRGVEVHAVASNALRHYVADQIGRFEPGWTLVASEDPGQVLLEAALPRAIYFAQTTLMLPFGPGCFLPLPRGREAIRRAAGVITISRYLQNYLRTWGGVEALVLQPPIFGRGPYPRLGRFGSGRVTMVNPCVVKGISIFAALAERLPDVPFAAVCTWGTTADDLRRLARLPNVRVLEPADAVGDVLAQTSVLLVPSLWAEGYGYVVVDAMLHGIPVLASDVGGLPEAKLGVDYLLPVRPIERFEARFDDRMTPRPVVPDQDVAPWLAALTALLTDPIEYDRVAAASHAAAAAAVATARIDRFETFFAERSGAAGAPAAAV